MLAFIGVLLFAASDSLLAVNRFVIDLGDLAPILVLGSYYPAQLFIGQSAGREHRWSRPAGLLACITHP